MMRNRDLDRRAFLALGAAALASPGFALEAPAGRIETLEPIGPGGEPQPHIRIWLPPGYEKGRQTYRTLYMLDGQFVFASDGDGQNFAADRRIAALAAAGAIEPALIVAIDNLEADRFLQYMP